MLFRLPSAQEWAQACALDGEFALAARHWDGGLRLEVGDRVLALRVDDGIVTSGEPATDQGVLGFSGDAAMWERLLSAVPPRFHTDLIAAQSTGQGLSRSGDRVVHAQYYAAAMRALELLRPATPARPEVYEGAGANANFDTPVGRYVHIELEGHDHRIYFEEAGEGIPLLMQHTAGCHGSQWRHLFEVPEITRHFRLIAYDLPYHGKSIPPVTKAWWSEPYNLRGEFLRAVPLRLASALELEKPVFMGCSVGGLLALDLACRHPESFRAVISVEGALNIEGDLHAMQELWHPQVSNEYKARAMEGLMSPTSPKPYIKETSFIYASGWPPAFIGDLYYYIVDFDLRDAASQIDTRRVGVHILSGEYDHSGTVELGREAHESIAGSTWSEMKGMGHFPMSENPVEFIHHLLPVLERVRRT